MSKVLELKNKKFGKLTVLRRVENNKHKESMWACSCDCGGTSVSSGKNLKKGNSKSCGCMKAPKGNKRALKHDLSHHPLYRRYYGIKERCENISSPGYHRYGGRGIKLLFKNAVELVEWGIANGFKPELSIDRINNNGNYSPKNCRFVDAKTQGRNRSDNRVYQINGVKKCISELSEEYGIKYTTLKKRLDEGVSIKRALKNERIYR